MRFIHTSDWHLGQIFNEYDRSPEHGMFLGELVSIVGAERPDALLVSGDIFHNSLPSAQSQKMFADAVLALGQACPGMKIVIIAGNHDSSARLDAYRNLWSRLGVSVIGGLSRRDGHAVFEDHIIEIPSSSGSGLSGYVAAVPYVFRQNYPRSPYVNDLPGDVPDDVSGSDNAGLSDDSKGAGETGTVPSLARQRAFYQDLLSHVRAIQEKRNPAEPLPVVLMAHLAVAGCDIKGHDEPLGGMDYTPSDIFPEGYDYLALGHIHHPQTLRMKPFARYSGSPLPLSFDEDYQHSVSLVDVTAGGKVSVREIPLHCPVPVLTIPEKPVPFDEALAALEEFPSDSCAYIRLNVKITDYLPQNASVKASMAAKGKACRYCGMKVVKDAPMSVGNGVNLSVDEVRTLDPVEMAAIYYRGRFGTEMDGALEVLLREVAEEIRREDTGD